MSSRNEGAMTAIENKTIVQHIFDELAVGNSAPLLESLACDVRFVVMGSSRWSKSYDGKEAVLADLFAPLTARIEGPIRIAAIRIIADGDLVVVEARGDNTTRAGKPYNNAYCNILRLEGGKLREWTEYCDTALVDDVLGDPAEMLTAR
jgi:ketosteroid isomerase-like protein